MEHTQHDNNDNNFLLVILILLINTLLRFSVSPQLVTNLQLIAVVVLILINLDKLYETTLKWYFKIKDFFTSFKKK